MGKAAAGTTERPLAHSCGGGSVCSSLQFPWPEVGTCVLAGRARGSPASLVFCCTGAGRQGFRHDSRVPATPAHFERELAGLIRQRVNQATPAGPRRQQAVGDGPVRHP